MSIWIFFKLIGALALLMFGMKTMSDSLQTVSYTHLHQQTLKKLNFRMRFKYGLKTQKLLAQGVWGKTYESSIKKRYKTEMCIRDSFLAPAS